MKRLLVAAVMILALVTNVQAFYEFNQQGDNERDDLGYYYAITGGKFPTGPVPNGDNASGGTFRFLLDDPAWGYPLDTWQKDDWFPGNAGLALTLKNGGAVVYDNNGIEDGTGVGFYNYSSYPCAPPYWPGLYRGYSMANNWDWIYATYFKLEEGTTFDTVVGYFDPTNSGVADFDPYSPYISYWVNIWSSVQDNPVGNPNSYMPAVASFTGNVFSSVSVLGVFEVSETSVSRVFPSCLSRAPDPIWRLVFKLAQPTTLPPGVYFFSHDAVIVTPVAIDIKPGSNPNSINLKSKGVVPVAVLTTNEFDASTINPSTVVFAGASPLRWSMEDVDNDGDGDLVLHFETGDLILNGNGEAVLTGFTLDGKPVKGTDSYRIVPK